MRLEMSRLERELDRFLTLLRNKIRERGFTQLEVQQALGWGRSYISQLLTKQKSLRVEQVLMILDVINVPPSEFFSELYHFPPAYTQPVAGMEGASNGSELVIPGGYGPPGDVVNAYRELSSLVQGLLRVLIEKKVIDPEELESAVRTSRGRSPSGDSGD